MSSLVYAEEVCFCCEYCILFCNVRSFSCGVQCVVINLIDVVYRNTSNGRIYLEIVSIIREELYRVCYRIKVF